LFPSFLSFPTFDEAGLALDFGVDEVVLVLDVDDDEVVLVLDVVLLGQISTSIEPRDEQVPDHLLGPPNGLKIVGFVLNCFLLNIVVSLD
jgi:hypothetical protein